MSRTLPYGFTTDERRILLSLARQAVEAAVCGLPAPVPDLRTLPAHLIEPAACFVTLHIGEDLRGCTGVLVARSPLALEVVDTAGQTALHDPRFWPVTPDELPLVEIEISVLTNPVPLDLKTPTDLPHLIRPGVDGVTLIRQPLRATFLPQVWDRVPDPVEFLNLLCQKMGLPRRAWSITRMTVETYQVEDFSECELAAATQELTTPLE